jgi:hypothetical protein
MTESKKTTSIGPSLSGYVTQADMTMSSDGSVTTNITMQNSSNYITPGSYVTLNSDGSLDYIDSVNPHSWSYDTTIASAIDALVTEKGLDPKIIKQLNVNTLMLMALLQTLTDEQRKQAFHRFIELHERTVDDDGKISSEKLQKELIRQTPLKFEEVINE